LGFAGLSFTIFIVIWLIPYEAGKQKKTREARTRKEIEDAIIEEAIEEAEEDE
jgi:hypothetical protein